MEVVMGGVLFFIVVVIALTLHHFLIERPRRRARELEGPHTVPLPLPDIIDNLPGGVFLHPTLTWGRLRANGEVDLGIHPLLLGLVGEARKINARGEPGRIEQGDPIAHVVAGDRELVVRSPTSGRIVATNPQVTSDASWGGAIWDDGSWGWVCRVRPDRLSAEIGSWLISDEAVEWTRRKYGDIRDGILGLTSRGEPELLLADGGEIPIGILTQLDGEAWQQFEKDFLGST
jgi:glycine cleavage system H lipoate-binding protein